MVEGELEGQRRGRRPRAGSPSPRPPPRSAGRAGRSRTGDRPGGSSVSRTTDVQGDGGRGPPRPNRPGIGPSGEVVVVHLAITRRRPPDTSARRKGRPHRGTPATARPVSSAIRSALIAAPAATPAAAELTTCASTFATLPATQTPGTAVAPVGIGLDLACRPARSPTRTSAGSSPSGASSSARARQRGATTTASSSARDRPVGQPDAGQPTSRPTRPARHVARRARRSLSASNCSTLLVGRNEARPAGARETSGVSCRNISAWCSGHRADLASTPMR